MQFLRQAGGNRAGRDATGLRMADEAADAAADFETDFGNLRRFAAACLARNNDDLVLQNRPSNLVLASDDRQFGVVFDLRNARPALLPQGERLVQPFLQPVEILVGRATGLLRLLNRSQQVPQPVAIGGKYLRELRFELANEWRHNGG